MKIYILIGLTVLYILANIVYSKKIKHKIKNIGKLFFINIMSVVFGIIIIFTYLSYIPVFDRFLGSILANSALLVAVLGFTLQNSIKNIVAGTLMSYSGAFKLGDRVTIIDKNLTGTIESMALRHTIIRDFTNQIVIVPNAILNDSVIINSNLMGTEMSYPISFTFPADVDILKAKEIIQEVGNKYSNKKEDVLCSAILPEGITLKIFIWTDNIEESFTTASDVRLEMLFALREASISPVSNNLYKNKKKGESKEKLNEIFKDV
ncbi:MAG: mechanosensitive ion channel [Eubacteriales bacterium]|nr:mechanosensitive ion channel [Eubacteriales bacterium]MDY3333223.1 mechanosensitive ion channel [Gallibacter sp.]